MKVHHVGYITNDIEESIAGFEVLGYIGNEILNDPIQNCKICLLTELQTGDIIELVQPNEDNLQMLKLLKKRGCSAYHICYEVDDVEFVYQQFLSKEGWMNIFEPKVAVALGGRKITYFYNTKIGFIEFVNSK